MMKQMTVVVFGGSGFIGSHLVAHLADEVARVIVPTRRALNARHLICLPGVEVVELDVLGAGPDALALLLAGADAAINLVGVLHSKTGTPYGPQFGAAHVELPRKIVAACARAGVRRYLHMSALGADRDGPSMYQRSKADGEIAARAQESVAATLFRPSVVFGPGDHFMNMFARMQRWLPVVPLACAGTEFQPVYAGDVALAYIHALRDPKTRHQVFALGGPAIYTLAELVRLAGRWSHHERPIIELPMALARLQARLFELLPGTPLLSRDNLDSMKTDNVLDPAIGALTAATLGIADGISGLRYLSPSERSTNSASRRR
jgi:NADH dehydrogenase